MNATSNEDMTRRIYMGAESEAEEEQEGDT